MWRRIDLVWTDVSEERIAYNIFRVEKSANEEPAQFAATCSRWFLVREFSYPEDGGDIFLRNVCSHEIYTAPRLGKRHCADYLLTNLF
jgi:hypothetical protein